MEYHTMSLVDLKKAARDLPKDRKIKQYYIKSRHELIQLLTMGELPSEMRIEKITLADLRKEAKEKGIPGLWKYRRSELCSLLYPSPKEQNKYDKNGEKHNDPEKCERKNVRVEVGEDLGEDRS
jgi:hypothetical protein